MQDQDLNLFSASWDNDNSFFLLLCHMDRTLRQRSNPWLTQSIFSCKGVKAGKQQFRWKKSIVHALVRTHPSPAAIKHCYYAAVHNTTKIFAVFNQHDLWIMDLIIQSCIQQDKALISLIWTTHCHSRRCSLLLQPWSRDLHLHGGALAQSELVWLRQRWWRTGTVVGQSKVLEEFQHTSKQG